jgi:hypothetical protein
MNKARWLRQYIRFDVPSKRRMIVETAKLVVTGLWIALIVWFVQGHASEQPQPLRKMPLRSQTETLARVVDGNTRK